MAIRAVPGKNGSENFKVTRQVLNDTGCTALSLSPFDAYLLGVDRENYRLRLQSVSLVTASDTEDGVAQVLVEINLMNPGKETGEWIQELACIKSLPQDRYLLSGSGMREHYYFATPPRELQTADHQAQGESLDSLTGWRWVVKL